MPSDWIVINLNIIKNNYIYLFIINKYNSVSDGVVFLGFLDKKIAEFKNRYLKIKIQHIRDKKGTYPQ